ncbi:sugar phosphorylase [Halobacillus sp. A5]|nr:sugar phosphorylase [Halobacillus sp. A5]MCP3028006.1 sugar phosphorylase [Halobacillus sp. A5]
MKLINHINRHLAKIYGEVSKQDLQQFETILSKWNNADWKAAEAPTEKNVYLIAYGDSIYRRGEPSLPVLHQFLKEEAGEVITDVHLLPMFPYTSDDGFSVTDYRAVNPELGSWADIRSFSKDFRMMFDFVANHMSKSSKWFENYLNNEPDYSHYFIPKDERFDASQVVRPRTSPLFHEYEGGKTAWTTFSEDQVDVNFKHVPVLVEMTDILLEYAYQGASSIRLDAIGFIWKKSGTTSIHLEEAHEIIKLWHTILNSFKPNTQIITETNVPHKENISYFGNQTDEANMVYQFSLPPLVLYSMVTHNAEKLTDWAKSIKKVSDSATYFNFLASHDGIGMRPTEGILSEEDRQLLVDQTKRNGGEVSYKSNPDGTQSVYELNINYSEALVNKGEDITREDETKKMLAAHSILLSVIGVPALYYHSLLGSKNDRSGFENSGMARRINREKLEFNEIKQELYENERRSSIFNGLKEMLKIRQQEPAFSPYADQEIVDIAPSVFALKRVNENTGDEVFFAVNTSRNDLSFELPFHGYTLHGPVGKDGSVTLGAYEFVWLKR